MSSLDKKKTDGTGLGCDADDLRTVMSSQATVRASNVASSAPVTTPIEDYDAATNAAVVHVHVTTTTKTTTTPIIRRYETPLVSRLKEIALHNGRHVMENTYLNAQLVTARDEAAWHQKTAERHRETLERLYRQACDLDALRDAESGRADITTTNNDNDLERKRAAAFPRLKDLVDENHQQRQAIHDLRKTVEHLRRQVAMRDRRHELVEEIHDLERGIETSDLSSATADASAGDDEDVLAERAADRADFVELVELWRKELRKIERRLFPAYPHGPPKGSSGAAANGGEGGEDDEFSIWSGGSGEDGPTPSWMTPGTTGGSTTA